MSESAKTMDVRASLDSHLHDHLSLFRGFSTLSAPTEHAAGIVVDTVSSSNNLILCGNGGSAADSQHLAAEFTGRFVKDRRPFAAVALSTDSSALTWITNGYSFDEVFSRQILGLGKPGDCSLAISTSGNAGNVIPEVEAARSPRNYDYRPAGSRWRQVTRHLRPRHRDPEFAHRSNSRGAYFYWPHVVCNGRIPGFDIT